MNALTRVRLIAGTTFREAVRTKVFSFVFLLSLFLVAGSMVFREFDFGSNELRFISDFGFGIIYFFGTLLALATTAQLFLAEVESQTALNLLAKPVRRGEFVVGKYLGSVTVMLCFALPLSLILMVILYWRETSIMSFYPATFEAGRAVDYSGVFLYGMLQWAKFCIVAAFTMLVCSFSRSLLYALSISFFILVTCQLRALGDDFLLRVTSPVIGSIGAVLLNLYPNLQIFNVGDIISTGEGLTAALSGGLFFYAGVYSAAYVVVAVILFSRREL